MVNDVEYVELGLACAEVCDALHRGTNGSEVVQLNQPALKAVKQLIT